MDEYSHTNLRHSGPRPRSNLDSQHPAMRHRSNHSWEVRAIWTGILNSEQIERLENNYEGTSGIYSRVYIKVNVEGEEFEAFTHITEGRLKFYRPTEEYASKMVKGLRAHGYDGKVVEAMEKYLNFYLHVTHY